MAIDTRTEAEKRYDAERDGSLYVKPQPAGDDLPLTEDEAAIIETLIAGWVDREQRRQAAWDRVVDILLDPNNDGRAA